MSAAIRDLFQSVRERARGMSAAITGMAVCVAMLALALNIAGCQPAGQRPAPEATPQTAEATTGTPSTTITLTWSPQNNCVNFSPSSVTIHVGDQVQFNSSVSQTVTIRVDSLAFGVADTVIAVTRGGNQTTHQAQTAGTYMWHSTPVACATTSGGPGPSVVIDEGMGGGGK